MPDALISKPAKNAMQSGQAGSRHWMLTIPSKVPHLTDPLMGWVSAPNTARQVRLYFDSMEEAIRYAKKHGLSYEVVKPKLRKILPKSYADNFRYDRPDA